MATTFRIPKQTDRELIVGLSNVRKGMTDLVNFSLGVTPIYGSEVSLPEELPEQAPNIAYALETNSYVLNSLRLFSGPQSQAAIVVTRKHDQNLDEATIPDEWITQIAKNERPRLAVKLLSTARYELRATDAEAAFSGNSDSDWNRYRDAQASILNSLQQTSKTVFIKSAEHNAELDRKRNERFEELEKNLRKELEVERTKLNADIENKRSTLDSREKTLDERESSFDTKESHYVARQKQTEQIGQIHEWLKDWNLTKGTTKKRWPIFGAYVVALAATGGLTIYATSHNYALLESVDEIIKLAWWQWVAIWAKSLFPLAAFATFMIYFIRWSGDWARQHSEEEFRNRTRLIDIGRSAWILEAVRDAQEHNRELPAELLRELSRNLFASSAGPDIDIHPQAISDFMMQGLSNLRVKSADGTEVEASRNKKSK